MLIDLPGFGDSAALPSARHVWLRGCGHVPMGDDPGQVAALILRGSAEPVAGRRAAVTGRP